MSLGWIRVSVRGVGGQEPTAGFFFECLGAVPGPNVELVPSTSAWRAARLVFFDLLRDDFSFSSERDEFVERIEREFAQAAAYLATCSGAGLTGWRSLGFSADVCVATGIKNDQMALVVPSEFLRECTRLELPVVILTDTA